MTTQQARLTTGNDLLTNLPESLLHTLVLELQETAGATSFHQLALRLSEALELTSEDSHDLLLFLVATLASSWRHGIDPARAADGIAKSVRGRPVAPALASSLAQIFESAWLRVAAELLASTHKHAQVFHTAEILTDVRPSTVLGAAAIDAAAILHHLQIQYADGAGAKVFTVTLDSADVTALRDALTRALERQASLEAFLDRAGVWTLP